jgi:hypothetical protein
MQIKKERKRNNKPPLQHLQEPVSAAIHPSN